MLDSKPDMRFKENRLPKQAPVKKGNSSWKPASVLDVIDKEPGYRYRWSSKSPDNLAKKQAEGWETVNGLTSDQSEHLDSGRIDDGKPLTTIRERKDCILQRIPEEEAQLRDEYYNKENARRTTGLTSHIKNDMAKEGAATHGNITISSTRGEQVID